MVGSAIPRLLIDHACMIFSYTYVFLAALVLLSNFPIFDKTELNLDNAEVYHCPK